MKRRFMFKGEGGQNLYSLSPETAARVKFSHPRNELMPRRAPTADACAKPYGSFLRPGARGWYGLHDRASCSP